MSKEEQVYRALTATEAEELTQHLKVSFSKQALVRSEEDVVVERVGGLVKNWYTSKKLLAPADVRVVINPNHELWVDVGHLLLIHPATVEEVAEK